MKKNISLLLFLITLFTSVYANNNVDTVYTYYDAERNKYKLKGNALEYTPITAKESSSGIYNGGTYKNIKLNTKEREKLVSIFNAAVADTAAQTNKNIKPNSVIEISAGSKKINFLLKAKSEINLSINNYLKKILKN